MSLASIRREYSCPAWRGTRVLYQPSGRIEKRFYGVITGSRGKYLRVRYDDGMLGYHHPAWSIKYLVDLPDGTDEYR